jgi:UMF1 family MFS transporter
LLAFVAILAFELSLVFYNAFLNEITDEESRGRVSGLGFAVGYIGGGLCLAINMAMMAKPAFFSLASVDFTLPIRASVGLVGVWWIVFSVPVFLWLYDKPGPYKETSDVHWLTIVFQSLSQLKKTLIHITKKPELARFLLAFLIYDDGVQTILLMASIFGAKEIGLTTSQLALIYLMVQFVAFGGALFWGRMADTWNHKSVITCTVGIFVGIVSWAVVLRHPWEFWVLAAVVGMAMGGVQAASRSFFSLLIPPSRPENSFRSFLLWARPRHSWARLFLA